MKFASMLRRLRNTQGGGMRSTAGSGSTPYDPYTDPPSDPFGVTAAASPQTVSVGTAVTFTGTVSNAPDGANLTYLWDFSDKANPTAGGSGVRVSYTYPTHGVKTATLTVSYTIDGKEVKASGSVAVRVIELTLAANPQTVLVDTAVNFTGTVSNTPEDAVLSYSWAFGAGATSAENVDGLTPSCEYDTHGVKTVTLTVSYTGADGEVTVSRSVDITVIALTLAANLETVTRGDTVIYTATVEPAGLEPTYNWRFTSEGIAIELSNGKSTWAGLMVVSGTIEVTIVVNGKNFTKSVVTTVEPKDWSDNFPTPPITHREPGTLRLNPSKKEHLGHTVNSPANPGQTNFRVPDIDVQVTIVTGTGPNAGWMFIANAPIASDAWNMEGHTSSALTDEGHSF